MISTRQKILRHASALLQERGLQNFTIAEVARRASISKGGVLHHFNTKEALIRAMIDEGLEAFQKRLEKKAFADGQPGSWTRAYVQGTFPDDDPDIMSGDTLLVGMANDRSLISNYIERQKSWSQAIGDDGLDPMLAWMIMLAADGLFFNQTFRISPIPEEYRQALLDFMISLTSKKDM